MEDFARLILRNTIQNYFLSRARANNPHTPPYSSKTLPHSCPIIQNDEDSSSRYIPAHLCPMSLLATD